MFYFYATSTIPVSKTSQPLDKAFINRGWFGTGIVRALGVSQRLDCMNFCLAYLYQHGLFCLSFSRKRLTSRGLLAARNFITIPTTLSLGWQCSRRPKFTL
jgi:hypothetical protein